MKLTKYESEEYTEKVSTSKLVKFCYADQCQGDNLTPEKMYALCRLTWLYDNWQNGTGYALWLLWGKSGNIPDLGDPKGLQSYQMPPDIIRLANNNYGIVNFYRSFRNSSLIWIRRNSGVLKPLVRRAASLSNDDETIALAGAIERLSGIPRRGSKKVMMDPRSLLTPLFSCLDPNMRFPIINQNERIVRLHRKLQITDNTLAAQVKTHINLIGQYGLKDALMIDAVSKRLAEIVKPQQMTVPARASARSHAQKKARKTKARKPELRDVSDLKYFRKAKLTVLTFIHKRMTNRLIETCREYGLSRTLEDDYDFLISNYDNTGRDLLVEAKSSSDRAYLRLAVGQLFDYRRKLPRRAVTDLAILIPNEPGGDSIDYLKDVGIGVLWFTESDFKIIRGTIKLVKAQK